MQKYLVWRTAGSGGKEEFRRQINHLIVQLFRMRKNIGRLRFIIHGEKRYRLLKGLKEFDLTMMRLMWRVNPKFSQFIKVRIAGNSVLINKNVWMRRTRINRRLLNSVLLVNRIDRIISHLIGLKYYLDSFFQVANHDAREMLLKIMGTLSKEYFNVLVYSGCISMRFSRKPQGDQGGVVDSGSIKKISLIKNVKSANQGMMSLEKKVTVQSTIIKSNNSETKRKSPDLPAPKLSGKKGVPAMGERHTTKKAVPQTTVQRAAKKEDATTPGQQTPQKEATGTTIRRKPRTENQTTQNQQQDKKEIPSTTIRRKPKTENLTTSNQQQDKKEIPSTTIRRKPKTENLNTPNQQQDKKEIPSTTIRRKPNTENLTAPNQQKDKKEVPSTTARRKPKKEDLTTLNQQPAKKAFPPTTVRPKSKKEVPTTGVQEPAKKEAPTTLGRRPTKKGAPSITDQHSNKNEVLSKVPKKQTTEESTSTYYDDSLDNFEQFLESSILDESTNEKFNRKRTREERYIDRIILD